jgi:hypothetical protein
MTNVEITTLEGVKENYYVNVGFLDENNKELYLLCEITDYQVEIYTSESERFGKSSSFSIMAELKPIDKDWLKKYTDVFGTDEESIQLEKGFWTVDFNECEFIKKENND